MITPGGGVNNLVDRPLFLGAGILSHRGVKLAHESRSLVKNVKVFDVCDLLYLPLTFCTIRFRVFNKYAGNSMPTNS